MQSRQESVLRTINRSAKDGLNILTFPTHEAYQSNWASMPHTFYLFQGRGIKPWSNKYRELPANHILLNGEPDQIRPDMAFDLVLSQNKFGQFEVANHLAKEFGIPLISLEHTLPYHEWTQKHVDNMKMMRGDINVFISKYSTKKWGFDDKDESTRIIHHGIDGKTFRPSPTQGKNDGSVLTVVNDYINRDWCCGWSIRSRLIDGLPVNPVGDTPGFSKPANGIDDLVSKYQSCGVFLNTSTISPVPTALLEAMACGCPVVTTATCMIPEVVEDGVNGFISNDEKYLRECLEWCLRNPEDARDTFGRAARKTIEDSFSLESHVNKWNNLFEELFGKVLR